MNTTALAQNEGCLALADPTRRAILTRLQAGPLSVTALATGMPVSRSGVSQHLKILKDAGLVQQSREGKHNLYTLEPQALKALADYVHSLSGTHPTVALPSSASPDEEHSNGSPKDQVDEALERWPELWPNQDPIVTGLSARLMFIARLMDNALEITASKRDINSVELMILGTLKRLGPPFESTPSNLARASLLSPPGMSKRLDRLERLGLITRSTGLHDRRSVDVRLTKAGHETIDFLIQQHTRNYLAVLQLSPNEQESLTNVLRKVLLRLEQRMPAGRVP